MRKVPKATDKPTDPKVSFKAIFDIIPKETKRTLKESAMMFSTSRFRVSGLMFKSHDCFA